MDAPGHSMCCDNPRVSAVTAGQIYSYDILHKQKVSAEDVYLGASERDPSSAFCDEVVVVVQLPGEAGKDIDLDVTRQRFVLQAKKQ